jgi:hypothetical protein
MDSAMTDSAVLMCSSCAMVDSAGAMMVLTIIRLKPVAESTSVTAHLRREGQSLGFSASKFGEKATRNGSSLLRATGWGGNRGGAASMSARGICKVASGVKLLT